MRLHVEYAHSLDPVDWSRRHRDGLVPDRLPYGLNNLADLGFELDVRPASRSSLARHRNRVARKLGGGFDLGESLGSLWARRACDLSVCWDERTGVPAALRSRLPGEPPVAMGAIWITEEDAGVGASSRALARSALQRAEAVWTLGPAQLEPLARDWGVPPERLHLLDFAIDSEFWHAGGSAPLAGLVAGGGNDRHRDHPLLVEAIRRVKERRPEAALELVTSHDVEVPAGLGRRHRYLSHVEMRELYGRAAIVAVALRPNLHISGISVFLEGMACGRPVVVSETPGVERYIKHGENGLLVPVGDVDALAAALEELLVDREQAEALGRAARETVERHFSTTDQRALASILRADGGPDAPRGARSPYADPVAPGAR
ncbi:MAG: glycosyltransferase family 4 protein [Gaiellaceae bacterium]